MSDLSDTESVHTATWSDGDDFELRCRSAEQLYLLALKRKIKNRPYNEWAAKLDEVVGVGQYFRFLMETMPPIPLVLDCVLF